MTPDKDNKTKPLSRFSQLVGQYRDKFGVSPSTEPSSWSEKEWCKILEKCIKKNQTVEEMFGLEYSDDWDD